MTQRSGHPVHLLRPPRSSKFFFRARSTISPTQVATLEKAGVRFRNQVEAGPGGKQILIEDPDGNPIELHEYPRSQSP